MRNIVNGLLMKEGRVLLACRSPQRSFYPDCWSLPGGHIETGESPALALCRELREEIGIKPIGFEFLENFKTDPGSKSDQAIFHIYLVSDWSGEPLLRDNEHTELRWFSISGAAGLSNLALDAYGALLQRLAKVR